MVRGVPIKDSHGLGPVSHVDPSDTMVSLTLAKFRYPGRCILSPRCLFLSWCFLWFPHFFWCLQILNPFKPYFLSKCSMKTLWIQPVVCFRMLRFSGSMHGVVSKYGMQHALGDCYCDDWAIEAGKRMAYYCWSMFNCKVWLPESILL